MSTVEASIEYDLTETVMLRLIEHHHRYWPANRALRVATTALAGVMGGAAAYAAGQGWRSVVWAAIGALLVGLLHRWGGPPFNRAIWRRSLQEGKGAAFGRQRVSINAEGIRCVSAESESMLHWSAIDRVESDAYCMYFTVTGGGLPVPRAAFASEQEFSTAREHHRLDSRGQAPERLPRDSTTQADAAC